MKAYPLPFSAWRLIARGFNLCSTAQMERVLLTFATITDFCDTLYWKRVKAERGARK